MKDKKGRVFSGEMESLLNLAKNLFTDPQSSEIERLFPFAEKNFIIQAKTMLFAVTFFELNLSQSVLLIFSLHISSKVVIFLSSSDSTRRPSEDVFIKKCSIPLLKCSNLYAKAEYSN